MGLRAVPVVASLANNQRNFQFVSSTNIEPNPLAGYALAYVHIIFGIGEGW